MINQNELVHVLMMTYNHERYIKEAIESFLLQKTVFDCRLIIGDDCSTDNTSKIVKAYAAEYPDKITAFINNKNIGSANNYFQLLDKCIAKYVAVLEGDDSWTDPYKLQKQVDFLEKNPDFGLVHTDVDLYEQYSSKLIKNFNKTSAIRFPSGNILEELLKNLDLSIKTASVVVRTETLKSSYNPELIKQRNWMLGDLPTYLEIAAHTKIQYFDFTTATYRLLEESESRTRDHKKKLLFHLSVIDIRNYFWEKYSSDRVSNTALDIWSAKILLDDAYKLRNWELAKKVRRFFSKKSIRMDMMDRIKLVLTFCMQKKNSTDLTIKYDWFTNI